MKGIKTPPIVGDILVETIKSRMFRDFDQEMERREREKES